MINSIYTCYHNNMFWRKNSTYTEIKNTIAYRFVYISNTVPLDAFPQNESLMKKKMFSEFYIYLEQGYQKFQKYPDDSTRLDKQTILFPLQEMLSSQTKKNLSRLKKNYIDLIVNMKTENCKLINEWTLLFLSILHIYKHISVKSGLFKKPQRFSAPLLK